MPERMYGNNKVFCQGRFISGPDGKSCIASLLMICVPSILWQVEVGAFFASRYSAIIPFLTGCLQCASVALLIATAFSDPGIMPRQKEYNEQYDPRTCTKRSKAPQRHYELVLRSHPFKVKYCVTCNIYRPPRCTHCSVCENCIERFDHHCPWIGNCIGRRNYWLFYCFVTCTGFINAFVLATSASHFGVLMGELQEAGRDGVNSFVEALQEAPLAATLVVYCTLIVWFTVGLCMYHNYLICTNQTTYEQIKGVYSNGHNPFHRGIWGNYLDVLFAPVRPRFFNAHTGKLLWPRVQSEYARELKMKDSKTGFADQKSGEGNNKGEFSTLAGRL